MAKLAARSRRPSSPPVSGVWPSRIAVSQSRRSSANASEQAEREQRLGVGGAVVREVLVQGGGCLAVERQVSPLMQPREPRGPARARGERLAVAGERDEAGRWPPTRSWRAP